MKTLQTRTVTVTITEHQLNQIAALFIQKANSFKSQLTVSQGDNSVNAKSLLGFLSLEPPQGSQVTLTADGPDEEEALQALAGMLG